METVKQNVRVAEQKKRIKAYQEALEQKAGKHEADKTGKRDSH